MFPHELPAAVLQLLLFLSTNRPGLENAAALLGGPIAARRVRGLIDALSVPNPTITRWIGRELAALHRLLSLEDVANFDRPEAHYFSLIDPADPAVSEISLLTDGLTDCLRGLIVENLIHDEAFVAAA